MTTRDDMVRELMSKGRFGDTMLAHVNSREVAHASGVNPHTGLPEFFEPGPDTGAPGAAANGWGYDGPNGPTTDAGGLTMMPNYFGGGWGGGPGAFGGNDDKSEGLMGMAGSLWGGLTGVPGSIYNGVSNMFSPQSTQPTQLGGGTPTQLAGAPDNFYGSANIPTPPARPTFDNATTAIEGSMPSTVPASLPATINNFQPDVTGSPSPYGAIGPAFAPDARIGPMQGPNLPMNPQAAGTGYGNFSMPLAHGIDPVAAGLMSNGPMGGFGGNGNFGNGKQ